MKPQRAREHRKPIAERYQTMIACTVFCAAVAGFIYVFGVVFPPKATQSAFVIPAADKVNASVRGPR